MKTYVLMISQVFPQTHPRKGESTCFLKSIVLYKKIHTIRANYELWEKRISKINAGKAILSLRIWTGKPYRSKQSEVRKYYSVGIEKLEFKNVQFAPIIVKGKIYTEPSPFQIAKNDGLSMKDFEDWFKEYDLTKPMAIIHFSNFRYNT